MEIRGNQTAAALSILILSLILIAVTATTGIGFAIKFAFFLVVVWMGSAMTLFVIHVGGTMAGVLTMLLAVAMAIHFYLTLIAPQ